MTATRKRQNMTRAIHRVRENCEKKMSCVRLGWLKATTWSRSISSAV